VYDFAPTNFLVRHCGAMQVGIRKMERLVTPCLAFIHRELLRMCQPWIQAPDKVKKRLSLMIAADSDDVLSLSCPPHNLRLNPLPEDREWKFTVPSAALALPRNPKPGVIYGRVSRQRKSRSRWNNSRAIVFSVLMTHRSSLESRLEA